MQQMQYIMECAVPMKQIPPVHEHENSSLKKVKVGWPPEKQRTNAFLEVARFLEENDDEQITLQDLIQLYGGKSGQYRTQHLSPGV